MFSGKNSAWLRQSRPVS